MGSGTLDAILGPAGVAALDSVIESAPAPAAKGAHVHAAGLELRTMEGLKMEPISWLWEGWLAKGKFHLIAGAPEAGKTTIGLSMVATITSGNRWPDGAQAKVGNCLIWTSEDGLADTIMPRLQAMGADLKRVHYVEGKREADGKKRPFDPARDMPDLAKAVAGIPGGIDFLMLDPVVAAVGAKTNSHNNAETRNALQPVLDFAECANCAVLGVTHFTKGTAGKDPVERVTGSIAFGALARIVMIAAKNESSDSDAPRILVRAKSNIGTSSGGFGYDVVAGPLYERPDIIATRVEWQGPVEGSARALLAEAESDSETSGGMSKMEQAHQFLQATLAIGERPQKEIEADAKQVGIAEKTLRRAAKEVVAKRKGGTTGGWFWSLKNQGFEVGLPGSIPNQEAIFGFSEPGQVQ
ncbi:AAA family ATPase [Beijerinckiaceae bacterium]|nr:AAA family ATPase [Beijerinckiaceae bacterium]